MPSRFPAAAITLATAAVAAVLCLASLVSPAHAAAALENPQPNAIESGITAISGWHCPAAAITIQVDSSPPFSVPYGSERADAASLCNGALKTGFSYLFNWNTLQVGPHTLKAFADGVQFASVTVNVVSLGAEFLAGKAGEYWLPNFPDFGKRTRITWQQSKQNFVISSSDSAMPAIDGTYIGSLVTTTTGCTSTGSNGGPVYDFYAFKPSVGSQSQLTLRAENSNVTCDFTGAAAYATNGGHVFVPSGTFACSSGVQGTWSGDRLLFDASALVADVTIKYNGETCTVVGKIGATRLQ